MGKRYLFSPVGNTDPIKYFYDGSMLHICRIYKPDIVYLYLSKEILENHRKDNRYVKTLELLGKKIDHDFEIRLIEREDLVNVQQYDVFYKEFRDIIGKIEEEMQEGDQLLLNMASGTPAMKSALIVMATLTEYRFCPIQVSTPKKMSNLEHEERDDYDVDTNWELDEDNKASFTNRCSEVQCMNLIRLLKIEMIKKHLLAYDYHAASAIGRELKGDISQPVLDLLEAAEARVNLDWKTVVALGADQRDEFCPIREGGKRKLFEYALGLDIKLRKGEYADFVRAITPLGVDLLELAAKQYCKIDLTQYYMKGEVKKWNRKKLEGTEVLQILEEEYTAFHYGVVYTSQINKIVQRKCMDKKLAERAGNFVEVEGKVRNIAAHDIVSVTDAWIKDRCGKYAAEIMEIIRCLCGQLKICTKENYWNSYDAMNRFIIAELEKYGSWEN